MKAVQLVQTLIEELKAEILDVIKKEISDLKIEYHPKIPDENLTRAEVAELFKVDITTIHNWTKKGILKPYGMGRRVYYKRSEVESALTELN